MSLITNRWAILCLHMVLFSLVIRSEGQEGLTGNGYMERQLLCALDRAPCDALGSQIKRALPEIIGNNCKSCDQRQAANARRIAKFVRSKYPDVWNALVDKYAKN